MVATTQRRRYDTVVCAVCAQPAVALWREPRGHLPVHRVGDRLAPAGPTPRPGGAHPTGVER